MKILALSGRCASGKGTIASIIKAHWATTQIITTGDVVRKLLSQKGVEITHKNVQAFNQELVRQRGDAYISFIFEFFDQNAPLVVIDSFRRIIDIKMVETKFHAVTVIGATADAKVRYTRLKSRNRAGDPTTPDAFEQLSRLEDSWGVDEVVQKAQLSICNTGTLNDLRSEVLWKLAPLLNTSDPGYANS